MYKSQHYTDSIFYQIEKTAKLCRFLGQQVFQKLDMPLSMDEFTAMDVIIVHGEICQRELARLILKDRPNTGRILDMLEEKGYIERFVDTKNNRLVKRMRITLEGKYATEKTSAILREYINNLPKIFSDEDKDKLKSLIIQFRKSLEETVEMKI